MMDGCVSRFDKMKLEMRDREQSETIQRLQLICIFKIKLKPQVFLAMMRIFD